MPAALQILVDLFAGAIGREANAPLVGMESVDAAVLACDT